MIPGETLVYVAPDGSKVHESERCAGDNALPSSIKDEYPTPVCGRCGSDELHSAWREYEEGHETYSVAVEAFTNVSIEVPPEEDPTELINEAINNIDRGDFVSVSMSFVETPNGRWEQAEARDRGVDY